MIAVTRLACVMIAVVSLLSNQSATALPQESGRQPATLVTRCL
jgi:hypothetical protein